ncbi:peptidylprolyl isomerase [Natroniella sp. ANB-PHB2]|uniref:peptidylprolyl isomerase n=1 Tax=Natroniella sp. ANB-PHB2 TaxID=3384444 RepID=UPI0038D3666D
MIFNSLRNNMKIVIYVVVITFALGGTVAYLGFSGNQNQAATQDQQLDPQQETGPIAVVNGEEVLYQDYSHQLNNYLRQYGGQISGEQILELKDQVLNSMIEQHLILQEVENRGIDPVVSDEEVEEQMDQIIEMYSSSEEEFEQLLEQSGVTIEQVKEDLRINLAHQKGIEKLIDQVQDGVEVSEDELIQSLEEVTASHILIQTDDKTDEEAKTKAEEVLELVKEGRDFVELAEEYSEDPSAQQGGELGSFGRGEMVSEFEDAAFALEVGEISDLVKTNFGYHIIKVTDKQEASDEEIAEQREELIDEMLVDKQQRTLNDLVVELKEDAEIEIKDSELEAFNAAQDGNYEEALASYQTAIAENPNAYYLYNNLAEVYRAMGDREQIVTTYQEAIDRYPEQISFYKNLGQLYLEDDKTEKAIDIYQQGLAENEDEAELYLMLGDLYLQEEDDEKALENYEQFTDLSGDDLMGYYRVYNAYQEMGLEEKADEKLNKIKKLQENMQQQMQQQDEALEIEGSELE